MSTCLNSCWPIAGRCTAALLLAWAAVAGTLGAQPVVPPSSIPPTREWVSRADSSCVALPSWDHGVVCGAQSRREEYVGGLVVGGAMGALVGVPTGLLFRGHCNHGVRSAAGRGALAGMAVSTLALTVLPRVPRAELARRRDAEHEVAQRSRPRRVWMAVRPVVTLLGTAALGGAMIGAFDGANASTACGEGAGTGAVKGAGTYTAGAGSLAVMGALLVWMGR